MGSKRIDKELQEFTRNPPDWVKVKATDSVFHLKASLMGPEGGPFDKGVFVLDVAIPPEYPFKAPTFKFDTKVYHPNVKGDGAICLESLGEGWSPQLKIHDILLTIRQLLSEPNLDHPLEAEIAQIYKNDKKAFNKTAAEWTKKYATPSAK